MTVGFSSEPWRPEGSDTHFSSAEEKNCQSQIPRLVKQSLRNEGQIKIEKLKKKKIVLANLKKMAQGSSSIQRK